MKRVVSFFCARTSSKLGAILSKKPAMRNRMVSAIPAAESYQVNAGKANNS